MSFDYDRPFMTSTGMQRHVATDPDVAARYGRVCLAAELSNTQYDQRYQRMAKTNNMRPPPSHHRIFSGYLVVRRVGTPDQYETWMPDHVFHEIYAPERPDTSSSSQT